MNIAHLDTTIFDTVTKFLRAMKKVEADFTEPMQSVVKRRNLAEYLQKGCPKVSDKGEVITYQLPEGHELARLLLGDDYITPEKVATIYGEGYTTEQLEHFDDTFPDKETIFWLRANEYMLIAGPPKEMDLLEVRKLNDDIFLLGSKKWYHEEKQKFARTDIVRAGEWLMFRKKAVPDSLNKKWHHQKYLIIKGVEYVPNATIISWAFTTYYKIHKICLLSNKNIRTSSIDAEGDHVLFGALNETAFYILSSSNNVCKNSFGVASARLPADKQGS